MTTLNNEAGTEKKWGVSSLRFAVLFFTCCLLYILFVAWLTDGLPERPAGQFLPPNAPARAFQTPLPREQDPAAVWLLTIPLRVLNVDTDSGIANVETPDGNTFLLGIRGLAAMKRGAYFRIVKMTTFDSEKTHLMAVQVPESDIDFATGKFIEDMRPGRKADFSDNVGP